MVTTRQVELQILRAQTWIAAINVVATVILSIAGIWIAHQVNENADRQRKYERAMDDRSRSSYQRQELINSCLNLKLTEKTQKQISGISDDELASISRAISQRCDQAGLKLDGVTPQTLSNDELGAFAVAAFLKWASEKPSPSTKSATPK